MRSSHKSMYLTSSIFFYFLLLFIKCIVCGMGVHEKTIYKFVEYPYKDTTKNEIAYREYESACEQTSTCAGIPAGPVRTSCVRECISPSCHRELYAHDPLEDGEIDVRLTSFKGCFTHRLFRPRQ